MNAAQLDRQPESDAGEEAGEPFALKQQVAERLAAHRARRGGPAAVRADAEAEPQSSRPGRGRSAAIAAAVAERYAQSPSYRAVLAEESARSLRQAEATAEVASINARAIARAQQQLLADLGGWDQAEENVNSIPIAGPLPSAQPAAAAAAILAQQKAASMSLNVLLPEPPPARVPTAEVATPAYTVRLYEDAGRPVPPEAAYRRRDAMAEDLDEQESMLLDEEIAFRHDPSFTATAAPEAIPANLIEFPRQLIAARKARPRLAEGPLREDESNDATQLRIFEVEAEHISVAPAPETEAPEWSSILLPAQPATTFFEPLGSDYVPNRLPQTAPLSRRLMSGIVDLLLITACVLASIAVFLLTATHITHAALTVPLPLAAITVGASFLLFGVLFHLLFFTFSEATPGMRYAHIALCTISDENPTRHAMRRRMIAMALSAMPLGLGYLWAMLDEDGLGWHDRMSRMYQRAY